MNPTIAETRLSRAGGMAYPAFYDAAPRLRVFDPLSHFLGAVEGGIIEYTYLDVVKLAGHSCPTVAGAYLMTVKALGHLYGGALPVRGEIEVHARDGATDGTTGVVANVAALLTGAARETGFKGIAGRFDRRDLLFFGATVDSELGFRRRDTGAAVQATFNAGLVPLGAAAQALFQRLLAGDPSAESAAAFRTLWQDRVKRLLVDHADDPALVVLADAPIGRLAA
jgi:hypothetical protein